MKITTIAIAILAISTAASAGPTENITGCATKAVDGTNYTVRVDVACALPTTGATGNDAAIVSALAIWAEQRAAN